MFKIKKENHNFLSLMVAVVAVLLSQFPPIYTLFYSPEIEIGEASTVYSYHKFGLVNFVKKVSINNDGNEWTRIKKVGVLIIDSNGKVVASLPAKSFQTGNDSFGKAIWGMVGELALEPHKNWNKLVTFHENLNEKEYMSLFFTKLKIDEEIKDWEDMMKEKGYSLLEPKEGDPDFKLSDDLFVNVKSICETKLNWFKPGKYKFVEYVCYGKANEIKYDYVAYGFEINDIHITEFIRIINEHIYGPDNYLGTQGFMLNLKPNEDFHVSASLKKIIEKP